MPARLHRQRHVRKVRRVTPVESLSRSNEMLAISLQIRVCEKSRQGGCGWVNASGFRKPSGCIAWRQTLSTHIQYDLATRSLPDSASPTIRSDGLELACLEGLNVKEGT